MPGTALVMGVRNPAGGEITPRSVCGVKAPAGNPAKELLAGVVAGLFGGGSAPSKQGGAPNLVLGKASKRNQPLAGGTAAPPKPKTIKAPKTPPSGQTQT